MHRRLVTLLAALTLALTACGGGDGSVLTVYSGRNQELIGPLFEQFQEETGIGLQVRYADSIDLAATLREEGSNSPADVFLAVDPASLGSVAAAGLLQPLPASVLERVPAAFSDREGRWVGISGRVRTVVYDSTVIGAGDLPTDLAGFTSPEWRGRLAIAPTNGSFVAMVAAMILLDGEEATREWLEGIAANRPVTYPRNSVIVEAVNGGEAEVGLVNHYYLLRLRAEVGNTAAAGHFLDGGAGAMMMPSGAGILATSAHPEAAARLIEFLLSAEAQQYFVEETFEYPMVAGIEPHPILPPLDDLSPPDLGLSDLAGVLDLATDLIAAAGLL